MAIKKETGKERQFNTGARKQHATGKGTPVLVPGDAILDVAKHFEEGAKHYGARNWESGIPLSELLNSAERHLQQLKMGLTDESHDRAFVWNAIVYLATKLRIAAGILPKELDDMPRYEKQVQNEKEHVTLYLNSYKITYATFNSKWYICERGNPFDYLHKDLKFHDGALPENSGYYKTRELAEETLQAYLDKERG